jgi:cysteine-rich repeat protein
MMRQFEATTTCGDGVAGLPAEECDDGNGAAGDGCSPTCTVEDECQNGVDDDGDGLVDYPADPGCTSAADFLETDVSLPCDDGIDNDGDGGIDFDPATFADPLAGTGDPGCFSPAYLTENTQCQDGIDNDGDGLVDFDGGAYWNGGVPLTAPDPQCVGKPFRNQEKQSSGCGLGAELVLLFGFLGPALRLRTRH